MLIGQMRRTMREDEAGQALVLGALTMLVLALSVMVTVQLGWSIDKRIQLQNAADNTAFSTSAAVARCLNFIAWMNRASVAHYVSMMAFQSYASFFTGVQTIMFLLADLLQQISAMACVIAFACQKCMGIPIVGIACAICYGIFSVIHYLAMGGAIALYTVVNTTWSAVELIDKACAGSISLISWLNQNAMWLLAKAIKEGMLAMLAIDFLGGFQDKILQESACRDGSTCVNTGGTGTVYKGIMAVINAGVSYRNMFDRTGSEKIPDGGTQAGGKDYDDKNVVQNAERLMADIANGTRAGDGSAHGGMRTETSRGFNKRDSGVAGDVLAFFGVKFEGSTRLVGAMKCSTFHEGTGKCDGDAATPEPSDPGGGNPAAECESKSGQCETANNDAVAAEGQCSSANTACSNSGDPASAACTNATSVCNNADDKREDADDICEDAEDACGSFDEGSDAVSGEGANVSNGEKNHIFEAGEDTSVTSRGGALASAEFVKATGLSMFTGAGGKMVGIQTYAKSEHSYHCRFKGGSSEGGNSDANNDGPRHKLINNVSGCPKFVWTKDTYCQKESHRHDWHGISKYVSFRPSDDKNTSFNQPSFWSLANMTPDKARMPADLAFGFDSSGNFKWTDWKSANMDGANQPGMPTLMPGLNAWSISQVYYHRPGAWAEPPNLFNPFWRAKLAPVGPKSGELLSKIGLGQLGDILGLVLTH